MSMRIAVVGAGNGGFAAASQMALAGHDVYLYELPAFADNIKALRENPVITVSGALLEGQARLAGVSTDPADGFSECDIALVTTQTAGHKPMAEMLAPYAREDQGFFLMPGNCASIPFHTILAAAGKKAVIAECLSLPYACRKKDATSVGISRSTGVMGLAAFPSENTARALELYRKAYPDAFAMDNVLEVALCNANILLQPLPTLLSISRIEYSKGDFFVYKEAYTPAVEKAIAALDGEIRSILRALDFPAPSCKALFEKRYQGTWDEKRTLFTKIGSKGPFSSTDRYIAEDVPAGVALVSSLGGRLGVPTPIADAIISLAGAINGVDYRANGQTMEKLGLGGMDVPALKNYLRTGIK